MNEPMLDAVLAHQKALREVADRERLVSLAIQPRRRRKLKPGHGSIVAVIITLLMAK
ncbi:hypothetical protein G4Y79_00755 [Phototrophicus methaneseepsis]|uniref:Uncharacterized protein n=1 Tax=Phototrophicus methaneseepsis TaxID=2710758 RepID=A0A7S8IDS5_9CHLR|nr:hypothetical protein [Phototrophicus methaneseepsis]QPC82935.1 hypothetical protein G4Y79_00755 [Phototrophicus methaneseepsis]